MPQVACKRLLSRFRFRINEINRILDGENFLSRIIRDFHAKLFLKRHHQLNRIEAVGAEIVDKAGVFGDFGLIYAQMLDNDLLYACSDIAHGKPFLYGSFNQEKLGWRASAVNKKALRAQ